MYPMVTAALLLALLPAGLVAATANKPWVAPENERQAKNPVAADAASVSRGLEIYKTNCLACHGGDGKGKGPVATRLGFTAGDLTDAGEMASRTDGELFWKIATGRKPMPPFKVEDGLTDRQIWDVINYTRTLAAGDPAQPER